MGLIARLILYIYNTYLNEEWDILTKWGKRIIYPFYCIRCVYITALSPILLLGYLFENSNINIAYEDYTSQNF